MKVIDPQEASEIFSLAEAQAAPAAHHLVVPRRAVVSRRGRSFVLVARAADRIEPVAVRITHEQDGNAEILGPLAAGDPCVADGAIYLLNMLALEGVL